MLKIKKVKPLGNIIITTARPVEEQYVGGIIKPVANSIDEYQTVLAIGTTITDIKVGDLVCITPDRYAKVVQAKDTNSTNSTVEGYHKKIVHEFNFIELDNTQCLRLYSGDILFVVEEYENIEIEEPIIKTVPLDFSI